MSAETLINPDTENQAPHHFRNRCEATWNTCYPDRRKWSEIGKDAQAEWLRVFAVFESSKELSC